jgi:hypothetical protein
MKHLFVADVWTSVMTVSRRLRCQNSKRLFPGETSFQGLALALPLAHLTGPNASAQLTNTNPLPKWVFKPQVSALFGSVSIWIDAQCVDP